MWMLFGTLVFWKEGSTSSKIYNSYSTEVNMTNTCFQMKCQHCNEQWSVTSLTSFEMTEY